MCSDVNSKSDLLQTLHCIVGMACKAAGVNYKTQRAFVSAFTNPVCVCVYVCGHGHGGAWIENFNKSIICKIHCDDRSTLQNACPEDEFIFHIVISK